MRTPQAKAAEATLEKRRIAKKPKTIIGYCDATGFSIELETEDESCGMRTVYRMDYFEPSNNLTVKRVLFGEYETYQLCGRVMRELADDNGWTIGEIKKRWALSTEQMDRYNKDVMDQKYRRDLFREAVLRLPDCCDSTYESLRADSGADRVQDLLDAATHEMQLHSEGQDGAISKLEYCQCQRFIKWVTYHAKALL